MNCQYYLLCTAIILLCTCCAPYETHPLGKTQTSWSGLHGMATVKPRMERSQHSVPEKLAQKPGDPALRDNSSICLSAECVTLSATIASRMNVSADPCQDFYNYACGNFKQTVRYDTKNYDLLFVTGYSQMAKNMNGKIYEMLRLDREVNSKRRNMKKLYRFAQKYFRSCVSWVSEHEVNKQNWTDTNPEIYFKFIQQVYAIVEPKLNKLLAVKNTSVEVMLATLIKTGGISVLELRPILNLWDLSKPEETEPHWAAVQVNNEYISSTYNKTDIAEIVNFLSAALPNSTKFNADNLADIYANIREKKLKLTIGNASTSAKDNWIKEPVSSMQFRWNNISQEFPENKSVPPFLWDNFLSHLMDSHVNPKTRVKILDPYHVMAVTTILKELSAQGLTKESLLGDGPDVASFLIFDWLLSFGAFFPNHMSRNKLLVEKTKVVPHISDMNSAVCIDWTKKFLVPIISRMYQRAYHREDFRDVHRLVELVKSAAITSVQSQSWISPAAKRVIENKINSMKQNLGLDELTVEQLDMMFNETLKEFHQFELTNTVISNESDWRAFGTLMSIGLLSNSHWKYEIMSGRIPGKVFMVISPIVINAFYLLDYNQIAFPMGILETPIYHHDYPDYIKLGSISATIGHEIAHAFGSENFLNKTIIEQTFIDEFNKRSQCVIDKNGKFFLYPDGPQLNSNLTIDEDVADIIGTNSAVMALKMLGKEPMPRLPNLWNKFSNQQLQFIHMAQQYCIKAEISGIILMRTFDHLHSPTHLRPLAFVQNNEEFGNVFKCESGTPMNPKKKCLFW